MANAFVAAGLAAAGETGPCFVRDAAGDPGVFFGLFLGVAVGFFIAMDERLNGSRLPGKEGEETPKSKRKSSVSEL